MSFLSHTYKLPLLLIFAAPLLLGGCASYTLDRAQHNLRDDFSTADYEGASTLLDKMEKDKVYKSKDAVLLHLERGIVHHFSGSYEASNHFFHQAEDEIDANFTSSISRGISSILINDNALAYDGEDYEDVYLNVFKTLNFIHLNDYEAALVEARRIAFKLENIEVRNRGLAETISRSDSLNYTDWETGDRVVENSALGHYLSAILFAKTNRADNARIETERLFRALDDQQAAFQFSAPPAGEIEKITDPDRYNLLITGFSGRAPVKEQNDFRIFLDPWDSYFKFSVPSLRMYPSSVARVEVVVADTLRHPTYIIEEMDRVAKDIYQVKEPVIYARALTRSVAKTIGVKKLTDRISDENESLGLFAWLLGLIGQEITEKADLRSWQTLPGKAHVNTIKLPPGVHDIAVEYFSHDNQLLYSEEHTIEIFPGNDLALLESLYWY